MASSFPEVLIAALTGFVLGVVVGQLISFRRVHGPGDDERLKVELERHPFGGPLSGRVFRIVLVGLFILATAFVVQFSVTQRGCNAEFRRTIAERAEVIVDNDLVRKENDQAVYDLVTGFLAIPPGSPDARDRSRALLESFAETTSSNNARQDENARLRAANPYPRC